MIEVYNNKNIVITGGYGFIGNYLLRILLKETTASILVVDALTYACTLPSQEILDKHHHLSTCITSNVFIKELKNFAPFGGHIDYIFHLAAESHVDNSINTPFQFINTNIIGTYNVLEAAREFNCRVIHVSTDEVYGDLKHMTDDQFTEKSLVAPRSPYSATKASADLMALAYNTTYGVDVTLTRCCNNFGVFQHKEKFIPKCITALWNNEPMQLYGNGLNIREWIHAKQHVQSILKVGIKGKKGEIYNIGTGVEYSNMQLVYILVNYGADHFNLKGRIEFIKDRPGHDFRYAVNTTKFKHEIDYNVKNIFLQDSLHEIFSYYKP